MVPLGECPLFLSNHFLIEISRELPMVPIGGVSYLKAKVEEYRSNHPMVPFVGVSCISKYCCRDQKCATHGAIGECPYSKAGSWNLDVPKVK